MKRLLALLLCLVTALSLVPAAAAEDIEIIETEEPEELIAVVEPEEPAAEAQPNVDVVASGYCGTETTWTLYSNGNLKLEGSWTPDYPIGSARPGFYGYRDEITSITCDVSTIGEALFYGLDQAVFAYLYGPKHIGDYAFAGCDMLSEVSFSNINEPTFADNCFQDLYLAVWYSSELLSLDEDTGDETWTWPPEVLQDYGGRVVWLCIPENEDTPGYIALNPESVEAEDGETVAFLAAAYGDKSAQWQYRTSETGEWKNSTMPGNKTSKLLVPATAARNGYQYRCKFTFDTFYSDGLRSNDYSRYTEPATLTIKGVSQKPRITTQPKDVTIVSGGDASFTVKATGVSSYQWYWRENSSASWQKSTVSTAKSKTLVYKGLTESKSGRQYRCKLTNSGGSVYTKTVTLTVTSTSKPTITTQPKNLTIASGGDASFTVKATGVVSYQWYWRENSSASWQKSTVSTANKATLSYTNLSAGKSGRQYRCKLTNSVGSVYTNTVTLTVVTKPTITTQPASKTVSAGTTVKFTVKADGGALKYQWYYRTSSSGSWTKCTGTGAATATLTVEAKTYRSGYQYRCRVSNAAGYVYTKAVTMTVK